MIKIVYRNLSPGLHASAEAEGRNTIISFLPGLTPEQRRAALRRIRHSGRMGHGPRVPAGKLMAALAVDRIRAAARTGAAVVRLHPAGSTLPVVFFSAAAVIFVSMATVSDSCAAGGAAVVEPESRRGRADPAPATSAPAVGQGTRVQQEPGRDVTDGHGAGPPRRTARFLGRDVGVRFAGLATAARLRYRNSGIRGQRSAGDRIHAGPDLLRLAGGLRGARFLRVRGVCRFQRDYGLDRHGIGEQHGQRRFRRGGQYRFR